MDDRHMAYVKSVEITQGRNGTPDCILIQRLTFS